MNRTTILRTLVLVMFCALAGLTVSVQAQTKNAQAPASNKATPNAHKQAPVPPAAANHPYGSKDAADEMIKKNAQQHQTQPPAVISDNGTVEKVITDPNDIKAYESKPVVTMKEGFNPSPATMNQFLKDYSMWMKQNPNYKNVLSKREQDLAERNLWAQLYQVGASNTLRSQKAQSQQLNTK
jgi:hypothetical protein